VISHDDATRGAHRHHPWRVALSAAVLLVLVAFAYPTVRYALRSHPKAKSMESAIQQFRGSTSIPGSASTAFLRPRAGVYRATGSGRETISFPPNAQSDGAVMPVTVRYLPAGCWQWRIDYNTAHWSLEEFCPKGSELLLVGQQNYQSWDFGATKITNLARYTCNPPSPIVVQHPRPGQTFRHACTGTNTAVPGTSTAAGPATIVGTHTLTIGSTPVRAIHQTRRQILTGAQKGEIDEEWWFAADTGLPLRSSRRYELKTPSPLGTITYTENGSWALTSLQPAT